MKNITEYFILCDSYDELISCAKILNDAGYTVYNFNSEKSVFTNPFGDENWTGLSYFGSGFIRSKNLHSYDKIKFKVLQRKYKLLKINSI
jgi:hypothetical protein